MIFITPFVDFIMHILTLEIMGSSLLDSIIQLTIIIIIFKLIKITSNSEKKEKKDKK